MCDCNQKNINMGCCVPVLAPIENFYNKWQTERYVSGYTYSKEEIDEKVSSGCCITPEEVDEKILESTSGFAYSSDVITISGDVMTISGDVITISGDVQSLSAEVERIIISGVSGVSSAECQTMIDQSISGKMDTATFQSFSATNKTEVDSKQPISGMTAYTPSNDFTAHTANTTVHVTSNEKQTWNNKPNIWSGTEAEWTLISGGTLDNQTIYLIYDSI